MSGDTSSPMSTLLALVKGVESQMRPGCFKRNVDAQDHWERMPDCVDHEYHYLGSSAVPTPYAIVVMSNKKAGSLIVQANSATSAMN